MKLVDLISSILFIGACFLIIGVSGYRIYTGVLIGHFYWDSYFALAFYVCWIKWAFDAKKVIP